MPDTNHILDAIDHALEDWAVSGDAMRWAPSARREGPVLVDAPEDGDVPAFPVWIADYSPLPVDTSLWQVIGYTDETHIFREADLRPYTEVIRQDIRRLAALYSVPVPYEVFERVFMNDPVEGGDGTP